MDIVDTTRDLVFETWLARNAGIWHEFCQLADKMRATGRKHYSARAILHVLRWHRALQDASQPVFKINNNWSAQMARKYNDENNVDFFHLRDSATDY